MKKALAVVVGLAVAVGPVANAYVEVNVDSAGAYLRFGGTDWAADHLTGTQASLLWSANNIIEPILWDGTKLVFSGGDSVLKNYTLNENGMLAGNDPTQINFNDAGLTFPDKATFESGWAYLVVFDDPAPSLGDHYVAGSKDGVGTAKKLTAQPQTPPVPGDEFDMSAVAVDNMVPTSIPIVPEPGTFALLGVGLLTLAVRKARR